VTRYGFARDTEGAGAFRGGLALVRDFVYLADGIEVRTRCDRMKRPPWGILGGGDASPPEVILISGDRMVALPGKSTLRVRRGDRLHTQWCGGGGYGDPMEREPELVLADVIEDKISAERACSVYGVVIDETKRCIDHAATAQRRSRSRHDQNLNTAEPSPAFARETIQPFAPPGRPVSQD
jgi:N-methylhydantoinase B/oxoprolinase/acetone carboxylase alpha subunit